MKLDRYRRAVLANLDARCHALPWRRAHAARTVAWWLLAAGVIGATWFALAGYHAVFHPLNDWWRPVPDWLAECVTYCGDSLFALVLLLFVAQRYPQLLWLAAVTAGIATLLSRGLKALFDTARPGAVLPPGSFHLVGPLYQTHSFPSGHSVTAFALAASCAWFMPRPWMRWCAFALAVPVGLSRIGVGAHWPMDVLAGAAVGSASVLLGAPLAMRWDWGMRPPGHLLLVVILAGCGVALLLREPVYPLAALWAHSVAVGALALTAWGYLVEPALQAADRRPAVPRRR
ncbi:MAG: phosphatase PAP2 family protein [Nevskia sp.]|nr:phosphatase PAP2 family protein [Nevskia sp.]